MHFRPRFACYASLALLLAGPAFAFTGGPESRGECSSPAALPFVSITRTSNARSTTAPRGAGSARATVSGPRSGTS